MSDDINGVESGKLINANENIDVPEIIEEKKQEVPSKEAKELVPNLENKENSHEILMNKVEEPNNIPKKTKKLNPLSKVPVSKTHQNLRYAFQISLAKLSSAETIENGIKEIFEMFEKFNSDYEFSMYLSLLSDERKSFNLLSKEALMTIFSQTFLKFKSILSSDSFENRRNLVKIRDFLLKQFEETTNSFQINCSQCLISLYHNACKSKPLQYKEQIFIEPIFSFFQGKGNMKIQHTSSIYLQEFAEYLIGSQDNELFSLLKERIYSLFLKLKKTNVFYELLLAIKIIIAADSSFSSFLQANQEKFQEKLLKFLIIDATNLPQQAKPMTNINEYMCRVTTCEILAMMPDFIPLEALPKDQREETIELLKKNSCNRIVKVQKSALIALKLWSSSIKKSNSHNIDVENTEIPPNKDNNTEQNTENKEIAVAKSKENPSSPLEMISLQQARNQAKLKKGASYYEKQASFFERKKNAFVKKKTGLGGGFYPIIPKKQRDFPKNTQKNEPKGKDEKKLKEFILKTKRERKNIEKFEFLDENHENTRYNKAFSTDILNEMPKSDNLNSNNKGFIAEKNDILLQEGEKNDKENHENINLVENLQNSKDFLKENRLESAENTKNIENACFQNSNEENISKDALSLNKINENHTAIENINEDINQNFKDQSPILEKNHEKNNENTTDIIKNQNNSEKNEVFESILEKNDEKINESLTDIKQNQNNSEKNEVFDDNDEGNKEINNESHHNESISIENNEEIMKNDDKNMQYEEIPNRTSENEIIIKENSQEIEENKDELFEEEQNHQGDECMAPASQSQSDNLKNLLPPSMNQLPGNPSFSANIQLNPEKSSNFLVAESKNINNLLNMSIKESEGITLSPNVSPNEVSQMPGRRISSWFSNVGIASSLSNINIDEASKKSKDSTSQEIKEPRNKKNSNIFRNIILKNSNAIKNMRNLSNNGEGMEISNENKEKNDEKIEVFQGEKNDENDNIIENINENEENSLVIGEPLENKYKENKLQQIIHKNKEVLKNLSKQIHTIEEKPKDKNNFEQINDVIIEESMKDAKSLMEFDKNISHEGLEKHEIQKNNINEQNLTFDKEQVAKNYEKKQKYSISLPSNKHNFLNEDSEPRNKINKKNEINPQINNEKLPEAINLCSYQLKLESFLSNSQCSEILPHETTNNNSYNLKLSDYKEESQINPINISKIWQNSLKSIKTNDIDEAYSQILDSGDDLYLIRLMNLTGPCVEKLSTYTNHLFLNKIDEILESNMFDKLFVDFFKSFIEEISLVDDLSVEEQNYIFDILEQIYDRQNNKEIKGKTGKIFQKYKNYLKL